MGHWSACRCDGLAQAKGWQGASAKSGAGGHFELTFPREWVCPSAAWSVRATASQCPMR